MKVFDTAYSRTAEGSGTAVATDGLDQEIRRLLEEYGGTCYENGLYRIFNAQDVLRWTEIVRRFFPAEAKGIVAFGRDWQGNLFGFRRQSPRVLLFQPGTGDVFEVSGSIEEFHNEELTEHAEEALSFSLWKEWLNHFSPPSIGQCVAYKKPIFLGGEVTVDNLVIADLDVYWEVTGQLLEQVRQLPTGTPIKGVKLSYLN